MADDVRERMRRGDLDALLDPALPLHLLAEPNAGWWHEGAGKAGRSIVRKLYPRLALEQAALIFRSWARAHGLTRLLLSLEHLDPELLHRRLNSILEAVSPDLSSRGSSPGRAYVELARQLRATQSSAPAELDAALAVLERYAG